MIILDLLHNIALLLALYVIYDVLSDRLGGGVATWPLVQGLLFGAIAVVGMMTPVVFAPGVVYDGRSIVIAAGAYIGGPTTVAIAAVIAALYRVFVVGGAGATAGVLVILESAILGAIAHRLRKHNAKWERAPRILMLGFVIHLLMLACQLVLPDRMGFTVVRRFGIPVLLIYPVAFLLVLAIFLKRRERRAAFTALDEREAQYRALFDNGHAPMLVVRPGDARILDANRAAEALYGWSREELRQMHVPQINVLPPERILEELERARAAEERRFEFRHRRKDGTELEVAVFSGTVLIRGEEVLYSIIEDITRQKEKDRELYLANHSIERSAVAIYRIQEETGRIDYVNRRSCELLGYTAAELISRTIFDLDPTYTREGWQRHRKLVRQWGSQTVETVHRCKDGTELPVEVTVTHLEYQGESFLVTFGTDITERKAAESKLRLALEEKQLLLREIHHRVRNNLTVINGLIYLQIAELSDDDASLEVVRTIGDRIGVMAAVHDLMYRTQDLTAVDFAAVVRQIAQNREEEYPASGRREVLLDLDELEIEVEQAVPLGLIVNEGLTNAFKHAHPAGADGTVTIVLRAGGENANVLSITDDGIGVPPETGAQATLGTQLMRSLASQINADIAIASSLGRGTAVNVRGFHGASTAAF